MATFGHYETDRPLYRTGFNAIYLSRSGTKGPHPRVVKAYQPSLRVDDEKLSAAQSDAFLDSAGVQQKAAGKGGGYWAPIHESGVSPEGVFYVTDHYDLSAQQLVDGRANLGAAGLCRIVESVVRGLLALKHSCGRPHGNLKFTNILITRRGTLTGEKVVLSDPCPGSQLDEDTHAKMDLRQLGVLIHQLVMHHNPPLVAGYQAPDSQEWQRLGRRADAWRNLCNRLLMMDVAAERITLEELLAGLPGVAWRGWRRLFKAAACLCVIAMIAVLYRPIGDVVSKWLWPTTPEEARMAYLQCAEARTWLPELWHKLDPSIYGQRVASWKKDTSLAEIFKCIDDYGKPFEKDVRPVIPETPDEARLASDPVYRNDIGDANKARVEIEAILFGETRGWSLPGELASRAVGLREAKCETMAGYMELLLASIDRHEELAERIDDVLYLKNNWHTVNYAELEPNAVGADPGLAEPVADAKDFVDRLRKLPGHYRTEIAAFDDLLAAQKKLQVLLEEVIAAGDTEAEELRARSESVVAPRVAQIRSTPFTKGNASRVTDECRIARNLIGEIELQIKGPDQWFDEWRAQAAAGISSSRAINDDYTRRLDAWLGADRGVFADQYKGRWSDLRLLRSKVDRTRENLRSLDANDTGLPRTIAPESASSAWSKAICEYYADSKREVLIGEVIAMLTQQEPFPDPNDYPEECRELLDWPKNTVALIADFAAIEARLNAWYGFTEDVTEPTIRDPNIETLYGRCRGTSPLKDAEVSESLTGLTDRVKVLEGIEAKGTRNEPNDMTLKLHPEAAYAIWLRADPNWPSEIEQWQLAVQIQRSLKDTLKALPQDGLLTSDRITFLNNKLDETLETREGKFLLTEIVRDTNRVKAKAEGDGVLVKLGPFGGSLTDMREYSRAVRDLADFVAEPNWPEGYDLLEFDEEEGRRFASEPSITSAVIRDWLTAIEPDYRRIADIPADERDKWDERTRKLADDIADGLEEAKSTGDNQVEVTLQADNADLDILKADFNNVRGAASIRKHKDDVKKRRELLEVRLPDLESRVESDIRPRYCRHLRVSEKGEVVFRSGLRLAVFEPVLHVPSRPSPAYTADEFVVLHARTLNEFRDGNSPLLGTYPDVLGEKGYFGAKDYDDTESPNLGWPKYVRAVKDPSVILRFVPQDRDSDPPPFYMAIREITNAQYLTFLHEDAKGEDFKSLIRGPERYARWYLYPPALRTDFTFEPNEAYRESHPVVWVTYEGAARYAGWLGSQLPPASWLQRAVAYSGGPLAMDPAYYHIRGPAWLGAAEQYNTFCRKLQETDGASLTDVKGVMAPLGTIREGPERIPNWSPLDTVGVTLREPVAYAMNASVWPMQSRPVEGLKLHDLVGNVWEWCQATSSDASTTDVFGRSCLSRLDCLPTDFTQQCRRTTSACDLGYRIAVACP
ncbi:MAG: SUMF1/EgtB/PvdO family nonheme iron enzyme [Phycisphaerales bacterium]